MVRRARGSGDGSGEVVEFVFQFEDDSFGGFFADAGDLGECGVVAGADGVDETRGVDATKDRDGQLGADAGDGEEFFEETLLLRLGEAVEGKLVFADMSVDVERHICALVGERGERGYADGDVVADACTLDHYLIGGFGEEASAEVGDHASGIVACGMALSLLARPVVNDKRRT